MADDPDAVVVRVDRKTRQVMTRYIYAIVAALVSAAVASQTNLMRRRQPLAEAATSAIAVAAVEVFGILRLERSRVVLYKDGIAVVRYP